LTLEGKLKTYDSNLPSYDNYGIVTFTYDSNLPSYDNYDIVTFTYDSNLPSYNNYDIVTFTYDSNLPSYNNYGHMWMWQYHSCHMKVNWSIICECDNAIVDIGR
jgi:hypothetical protein